MMQQTCLSGVVGGDERDILPVRNECSISSRSRARRQRLRRLHLDLTRACADLESSTESRMAPSVTVIDTMQSDKRPSMQRTCRQRAGPNQSDEAEELLFGPESVRQDKRTRHGGRVKSMSAQGFFPHVFFRACVSASHRRLIPPGIRRHGHAGVLCCTAIRVQTRG